MKTPTVPAHEAERLRALAAYGHLESLADESLDAITRVAATIIEVPIAVVSLVDETRQRFVAKVGLPGVDETSRSISFCGHAILDKRPMVVPDAALDERFCDNPLVTGDPRIRFYAGVPLVDDTGFALGTLCVIDRIPRDLSAAHLATLRDLSLAVTRLIGMKRLALELGAAVESEAAAHDKLAIVLEKTPNMLAYWNPDLTSRFANDAYRKFFGAEGSIDGIHVRDVIGEDLYAQNSELLRAAMRGEPQQFERSRMAPDGSREVAVGTYTPDIRDGAVRGVVVTLNDVSEARAATAELVRRTELLTLSEGVANIGHWRVDLIRRNIFWSPQIYRIYGLDPASFAPTLANTLDACHPVDRERASDLLERAITHGDDFDFELRIVRPTGEIRTVHARCRCERDGAEGPSHTVFGVFQDITSRKRAEEEVDVLQKRIVRQSEIYESMLRNMPRGAVLLVDRNMRYLSAHGPSVGDVLAPGQDPGSIVGRRVEDVGHEDNREMALWTYRETLAGRSLQMEAERGGRVFEIRSAPIFEGSREPVAALAYLYDISERKAAADALARSLLEKETLLKEIHHRVKNNLQVVGSIISLHANRASDERVRAVFGEVRGRVHAIALLHERLYRSADLASIDLPDYLERLAGDAARAAGASRASTRVRAERIQLSIDAAVPVGLIVNELVTNAFKHGLKWRPADGLVGVDVATDGTNVRVVVTDNGVGLPVGFAPDATHSLGMFLVHSLAKQIRGSVRFAREGAETRCVVTFPLEEKPTHGSAQ